MYVFPITSSDIWYRTRKQHIWNSNTDERDSNVSLSLYLPTHFFALHLQHPDAVKNWSFNSLTNWSFIPKQIIHTSSFSLINIQFLFLLTGSSHVHLENVYAPFSYWYKYHIHHDIPQPIQIAFSFMSHVVLYMFHHQLCCFWFLFLSYCGLCLPHYI